MDKEILSHIRISDRKKQANEDHLQGVADLTARFANEFGMGEFGHVLGLLHDKGKEQTDWQKYIRSFRIFVKKRSKGIVIRIDNT
jgi:CRISPR-associated endonuclease/helicase Cas3